MKIACFEVKDWERDYLRSSLTGCELTFSQERLDEHHLPEARDVDCLSIFIYSRLNDGVLDHLPQLKLITTRSTGFDHIDTKVCAQRGIAVANVPVYGENTVAEHTFALILSLSRNVHKSYRHAVEGRMDLAALIGFDLKDKTLGVIGAGRIGLHVIKIARGFGMRILVYDVRHDNFLSELLNFTYTSLEQLLAESDIISLHAPYMPATHHLLNRERLRQTKPGALLINTARGGLVDTDALIEVLGSGQLGGAGLDVVEGEELIKEEHELLHAPQASEALQALVRRSVLLKKDNVVFTPHNAFNSHEAHRRILDTTIENVRAWQRGESLNRVV
jgi:D-lactate dehydrogenase